MGNRLRWEPRLLVLGLLAGVLLFAGAPPAAAQSQQVETSVEAWYRGSLISEDAPFCILPCPPIALPESPQPENTLHVGVSGGREVARTYFNLDLSGLPSPLVVTGGVVTLPLAGPDAGTTAPELADLVACAVTGFVQPADGGPPEEAPEVDCSRSSPLSLDADDGAFTFDLGPLTTSSDTFGDFSVAVLASEGAREAAATWRVAFHGRDRDTEDARPITADVHYIAASDPPSEPDDTSFDPSPGFSGTDTAPPFGGGSPPLSSESPSTPGGLPQPAEPPVSAERPTIAPPPSSSGDLAAAEPIVAGYAYPQVWLLPLVFLGIGALLTRSLLQSYDVQIGPPPPA